MSSETFRKTKKIEELIALYQEAFFQKMLDVADRMALRTVVDAAFTPLGRIDVVVSRDMVCLGRRKS